MKKLSRNEMKHLFGGDDEEVSSELEAEEAVKCGSKCTGGKIKCPKDCPCKDRGSELGSICKKK